MALEKFLILMFFVVATIFSRKVAKNAKFSSFFCDFAALREPFGKTYFRNHKFQQYQKNSCYSLIREIRVEEISFLRTP